MTWGSPFRAAWEQATTTGRAAAREAALSPEKAAAILSDAIAHSLQLVMFAAQDMQRIQSHQAGAGDNPVPGIAALHRIMADMRDGRIAPEKSEKHLQQAARAMAQQARTAQENTVNQSSAAVEDIQPVIQRFNDQRRKMSDQLVAVNESKLKERSAIDDASGDRANILRNLAFSDRLANAFSTIDELFLDNKRVDDPAAPLPPPA